MIGVVNYGLGNIKAILNIYNNLNIPAFAVSNKNELEKISHLILPGVGSFDWAIEKLNQSGLRENLDKLVINQNIPILGICVGMQMMCLSSEEGKLDGLGWIDGSVKHFRNLIGTSHQNFEVPHMGWNSIEIKKKNKLLDKIENNSRFYFLHSYYFSEKDSDIVMMQTDYINWFTSCFQKDNIIGIQFHPEKSHSMGIQLLKNFSKL